jgi:DNA topoisomerase-2
MFHSYLDDDGVPIEPAYYVPVVPLVLLNGCEGLGVGWSTNVPCYHPLQVIDNILAKLEGREMAPMLPYYYGFKGTISQNGSNPHSFLTQGTLRKVDSYVALLCYPLGHCLHG